MLEKSICIAVAVLCVHVIIYWPGMIFHGIADYAARKKWPEKLEKPIFSCPICMTPYYGSVFYWVCLAGSWREWIVVIFVAMGINSLLVRLKLA